MAVLIETLDAAGNLVEIQEAGGPSPDRGPGQAPAPDAAPPSEAPSGDSAPPPAPEAAPPGEAPSGDSAPPVVSEPEDIDTDSREVPRGVQKRFDTLTRQREEERRANQALREQLAQMQGQLETLTRLQRGDEPPPPALPLDQQPEPRAEEYPSEQEWFKAVREWDKAQTLREFEQRQYQQAALAEAQRQQQALAAREAALRLEHADYDAQISTLGPKGLTPQVYQALLNHERGPDLGYYLAQHPEDLQRLAPLPPLHVWYELGRIEARLSGNGSTAPAVPSVVTSSQPKPAPLTPVGSGGSGAPVIRLDDPNVPQRDWEAETERQYPGIFGRRR
jgi:hypothetical protein